MTTVWIEVLTPKQALFFWPLAESLGRRGLETFITARRYEQLDWILRLLGLDALVLGRFGGENLTEKLESSTKRQMLLLKHLKKKPSVAISSGSVEMARICFGLQIPHLLASDSPHSPVNRLCVPISTKVLTPFVIGYRDWAVWGARRHSVLKYRALDPVAWIRRYGRLEDKAPEPPGDEYALVRVPEYKASYILGRGMAEALEVVRRVSELYRQVVVLCRYREEAQLLRSKVPSNVILLSRPVLALPYIRNASIVFSGGGTIAQEAALLGKPTILFYPGETPTVHRFLQSKGLLTVVRPRDYVKIGKISEHLTSSSVRREIKRRAEKLNKMLEDPTAFIEKTILSLLQ
ncbi:hypothetical protein HRbin02_00035 [Candidatus Calditenuaceae archaeon HR02]|nr:hypothetical protein HRbin02_00035 [Candidatus Calditenuaceae archaeon HR02]